MKLLLRVTSLVLLSALCVQSISSKNQPVRARKEDQNDPRKVTVTIIADNGVFKKTSTFTKNTDGLLPKKLYFDFSKGDNTITVSYNDEKDKEFGTIVSQQEAPEKSEIVIDQYTVRIDTTKAKKQTTEQEANKIVALIKMPSGSGQWTFVTGTQNLTASIAGASSPGNKKQHSAILGRIECEDSFENCSLFIYADQTTKIYTKQNKEGSKGKITTLTKDAIMRAGLNPIIIISDTGSAKIESKALYEQGASRRVKPAVSVQQPAARVASPTISQSKQGKDVPALLQKLQSKEKIDMPGADLTNAPLKYADLENVNLEGAQLSHATLLGTNLSNAKLMNADLSNVFADGSRSAWRTLNLNNATLTGANLRSANMILANLTNANLTAADLTNANLSHANLTGVNLTDAKLKGTLLKSVTGLTAEQKEYAKKQGSKEISEPRIKTPEELERERYGENEPYYSREEQLERERARAAEYVWD